MTDDKFPTDVTFVIVITCFLLIFRFENTIMRDLDRPIDLIKVDLSEMEIWRDRILAVINSQSYLMVTLQLLYPHFETQSFYQKKVHDSKKGKKISQVTERVYPKMSIHFDVNTDTLKK